METKYTLWLKDAECCIYKDMQVFQIVLLHMYLYPYNDTDIGKKCSYKNPMMMVT